ncbi:MULTISPECIES: SRPBCC family protein [Gordonia]|jgi:uncharacterized protein YndB with AHSA1/START domain|uniref:SRPBCC family protein n=2 Tax=Gordonia TaxID=2053 RepID=A0A9X3D3J2_9ACTN|nr:MULTISPECIES: SRPBCC family protein [Gordonia]MAU84940.1 polyketide cyclase [Gordonia sp. (in: high G+C Gram-positive bacteria)]MCF3939520.1 SRPBCC family protein [Gordonia tangerina]MCX2964328.1 SRPBCC family protein [Gordonia aquimaris]
MNDTGSRHISVVVSSSPDEVYAYAADPANLPQWAGGLASDVRRDGDTLVVRSPMGEVRVDFTPINSFGVLDHEVTLPDGAVVHNPLRVLPHPEGAEVVFTVRRRDLSDAEFETDCAAVLRDLIALRDAVALRS